MKNVTPNVQASDAILKPKLLDQLKRCVRDQYYSLQPVKQDIWSRQHPIYSAQWGMDAGITVGAKY